MIAGRNAEVLDLRRIAHEFQFAHRHPAQIGWHYLAGSTPQELFCVAVSEADNRTAFRYARQFVGRDLPVLYGWLLTWDAERATTGVRL